MSKTKLDWALETAGRGLPVFPLRPNGKEPMLGGGYQIATLDPETIKRWWEKYPDCNIGVSPGQKYVFIDIDRKNDKDGVDELLVSMDVAITDYLYETYAIQTTTGGYHLYYETDSPEGYVSTVGSETTDHSVRGVDIRGVGGYVVGPGSTINGKVYNVINDEPIVKIKKRWIPLLKPAGRAKDKPDAADKIGKDTPARIAQAKDFLKDHPPAIEGNGGDNWTFQTFCWLENIGITQETAVELAAEIWNPKCEPPWDVNGAGPTLETKCHNAYKHAQERAGSKAPVEYDEETEQFLAEDTDKALKEKLKKEAEHLEKYGEFPDKDNLSHKSEVVVATLEGESLWGSKALIDSNFKREMIIPNWIPAHGFTGILAPRNTGKSVLMIDMALRLASDMKWHDEDCRKGMTSFYICGEDIEGASQYAKCWIKNVGDNQTIDDERLCFIPFTVDLMDYDNVAAFRHYMVKKKKELELEDKSCIIFIDTWQRATSRGGMNKDEDMQTCVRNAEALGKALKGPVVIAFHPPKTGVITDISGSAIVGNSSSCILRFTNEDKQKKLRIDRVKGGKEGLEKYFTFEIDEDMGTDEYNKPISSVYIQLGTKPRGDGISISDAAMAADRQTLAFVGAIHHILQTRKTQHGRPINNSTGSVFRQMNTLDPNNPVESRFLDDIDVNLLSKDPRDTVTRHIISDSNSLIGKGETIKFEYNGKEMLFRYNPEEKNGSRKDRYNRPTTDAFDIWEVEEKKKNKTIET